jgi:hypothetical protein
VPQRGGTRKGEGEGWLKRLMRCGGLAGPTRLELATSGVTGRRSIQLNYDPADSDIYWNGRRN